MAGTLLFRSRNSKSSTSYSPGLPVNAVLRDAMGTLTTEGVFKDREKFTARLRTALKTGGVSLSPAGVKAVVAALGERDETAEICRDAKDQPEPDAELRDYENVPLKDDIRA